MISIIIPTLREGTFIRRTLENLKTLTLPHEVIVTDGGSKDETLPIVREYTNKVVVWEEEHRQTFGEAKNAGAALAQGDFLVFIDADVTIPNPDAFFTEMLALFQKHQHLVASTVPLRPWKDDPHYFTDWFFSTPLNWWYIISNNIFHMGNASGEFQMFRKEIFQKVGGYTEHLVAGEDTDMFYRVAKLGRTMMYPRLFVEHSCRRAHKLGWIKLYFQWITQGLSVLLFKKAAFKEWKVIR